MLNFVFYTVLALKTVFPHLNAVALRDPAVGQLMPLVSLHFRLPISFLEFPESR